MDEKLVCWDDLGKILWGFAGGMFAGAFVGWFIAERFVATEQPGIENPRSEAVGFCMSGQETKK